MASVSKRRRKSKPFWERGYVSHGLWQGNSKVGSVMLGKRGEADGAYRWQAGSHSGVAKTLAEAKRDVERAVEFGVNQLTLFDPED